MPWPGLLGAQLLNQNLNGSNITASSTANTPGSWVQLLANNAVSSTDTIQCVIFQAIGNNQATTADNSMLLDIGTGAAGSETVVAPNIAIGGAFNSGGQGPCFCLPIRIAGATRVAARVRSATGSRTITLSVVGFTGAAATAPFVDRLPTSVDTLGTSTSTSAGTAMSGSSGTWVEISSATTTDYQALVVVPSGPGNVSGATLTEFRLDLGIGASGSEQAVAFINGFYTGNTVVVPRVALSFSSLYGGFVPAGSRIAVRHNLAANPERVCACVIGVPYV